MSSPWLFREARREKEGEKRAITGQIVCQTEGEKSAKDRERHK